MDEGFPGSDVRGSCATTLRLAIVAGSTITFAPLPPHGRVVLGRDEGCDVRIDDRSVSRRHAALHVGPPLRIEDLGSANGTFVGEPQARALTARTHRLRRLSRESAEVGVGERFNLGATTVVVGRAPGGAAEEPDRGKPPADIVLLAPAMLALYEQAARAARSPISVLILGETGVGKEVLARTLHARSPRSSGPYVELNCAALPPSLLEGELFGHEKSAFTGASHARPGLLEAAHGGTLFLDEIGELPLAFQAKLLRVLEDRKVLRIGGRTPRRLDLRFVAATNRDLEAEIARGAFRQDLYFRLNGISLVVPPLRERVAEIGPLAGRFLEEACLQLDQRGAPRISPEALAALEAYAWPGNVRELRNVIERAAVLCAGESVLPADLPPHLMNGATPPSSGAASRPSGTIPPPPPLPPSGAALPPSGAALPPSGAALPPAGAAPLSSGDAPPSGRAAPPSSRATPLSSGDAPPSGRAALPPPPPSGAGLPPADAPPPSGDALARLRLEMKAADRQRVVEALERSAGNQTRAAKLLGVSLRTLINRIDEYGIPRPRKRSP
ncbi:sigma-54 dependent transcriptional regulator [Sorangium cellulosum So ce56]|uniref:Sigma-54 dependent transcriptional regulator n=1 Tax=Sorangium cellulosum (strain So ce56) TaxID=448385 RepID=A9GPV5_SORC5|nr:sigma-54-dependent Fis family transcriptional regulator [Sorangium cellulosum]CAN96811.1 sigma-54 dependent transcriptional regulator [Sorangium cellulosum So ce56]